MFIGTSSHEVRSAIINLAANPEPQAFHSRGRAGVDRETLRRLGIRQRVRVRRAGGHPMFR